MDFDWSSFFNEYELPDEFLISKNNDIWVNKNSNYYPYLKLPEDIRKFYENTDRKEYKSLFYYFLHHVKGEETANVIHLYPIEPEEPVKPLLQEAEDGYYKDVKKIDFILSVFNIIIIIFRFIKLAVIGALSSALIIGVIWSIIDSSIEVPSKEFYTGLFLGIFFLLVGIFVIYGVIDSWSKLNPYYIEKRKYIEYSYADKCFIQYKNNNKYQNDLIEYNKKKAEYDKLKKDIETQKTNYQRQKLLVKNWFNPLFFGQGYIYFMSANIHFF